MTRQPAAPDPVAVNKIFHDHECHYYDERFAIVHDQVSAKRARHETEGLLGRPLRSDEVVLDVGCGTGWLAAGLRRSRPELKVIGSDLSAGMLGRARESGAWPLVQADATRLPVGDGTVDLVVVRGVLHHLPDPVAALREWRRVIVMNGAVVLCSEPTAAVERHGARLVRGLLAVLRRSLSAEEDFWELASMAANLHVFDVGGLAATARSAGFRQPNLQTADWFSTMVLTASYVTHGRRSALARRLPWRAVESVAARADTILVDRLLPASLRHTVVGVLRP